MEKYERLQKRGLPITILATGALIAGIALGVTAAELLEPGWPETKAHYLQASRDEHDAMVKEWRTVESCDFDDGKMPEGFQIFDGGWKIEKGSLWAFEGAKEQNRTLGIEKCRWPAFRIEFDAVLRPSPGNAADHICDVAIRLNADPATGNFEKGYGVFTGHYGNQATTFYRLYIPYARTEFSPIEPGKKHHIALEVVKPHFRLWVDGKVVLDAWDRAGFMEMDPQKALALGTYDTLLEIDNLRISVPPAKS